MGSFLSTDTEISRPQEPLDVTTEFMRDEIEGKDEDNDGVVSHNEMNDVETVEDDQIQVVRTRTEELKKEIGLFGLANDGKIHSCQREKEALIVCYKQGASKTTSFCAEAIRHLHDCTKHVEIA